MKLRDKSILTFDVVGTLIDFERGILDYIHPLAPNANDAAILESYGRAEGKQHHLMPGVPFPKMLAPIYTMMAKDLRLPEDEASREGLRASIPLWPAFPDAVAALKRLKKHFRLVAMTNSDNWAFGHFDTMLGRPFDDKVTAEDVETCCKPDPQFFAYARGRQSAQGFAMKDYLHVAQSQYYDIGVAKSLGYATCWIERRKGEKGFGGTPAPEKLVTPDYHFASLQELADAVEAE